MGDQQTAGGHTARGLETKRNEGRMCAIISNRHGSEQQHVYLKYGQHLLAVPQECTGSNFTLEQLWTHVSVSTSPGAQIK